MVQFKLYLIMEKEIHHTTKEVQLWQFAPPKTTTPPLPMLVW